MTEQTRKFGFEILLLSLLVMMVAPGLIPRDQSSILLSIMAMVIIFSSLYLAANNKQTIAIGAVIALLILFTKWSSGLIPDQAGIISNSLLNIIFLTYVCVTIFRLIVNARTFSGQLISAALCMYLLLGLIWSYVYVLLVALDPEAIKLALVIDWNENARDIFAEMYYFSFVTLTTLGYGDVLPITRIARSLATMEAIIGQLYLAVVIASLVGIRISQRNQGD